MTQIAPSMLSADFLHLEKDVKMVNEHADLFHLDIMDGVFVPNISYGFPLVEAIAKIARKPLDTHLMIVEPEKYVERFVDAGADIVTFHHEATNDTAKVLRMIRAKGAKAAVSVKPNTPIEDIYPYLELCDMVLVMTVEPGYGGQVLIPETLEKVVKLKAEVEMRGLSIDIQVDGGINEKNAKNAISAGANILVAGSAVFKAQDRKSAIDALR